MGDNGGHAAFVDAWLAKRAQKLGADDLLALFDVANRALWARARSTLGEVTLMAIAERVLFIAAEKHPFLSVLTADATEGYRCAHLASQADTMKSEDLVRGLRFVLVEHLSVIGNLTAEILTTELHAELQLVGVARRPAPKGRNEKGRKRRA